MAASTLPLIADYRPLQPFARRAGKTITQAEALAGIQRLAGQLEPNCPYLNLCDDRYLFTLAFAAVCLTGGANLLPQSRSEGILDDLRSADPRARTLDDARVLDVLAGDDRGDEPDASPAIPGEHLAAIVFTSGSTGRPSPQHKYWRDLHTGTMLYRRRFFAGQPAHNLVATVPPQHMYGLETSVLPPLLDGFAAHSLRPFMPWDVARALADIPPPRLLVTTPVHLHACLDADTDMPAIAKVICATAPLSRSLAADAEATWNTEVQEIYGCTEAGSLASRRTTEGDTWTLYDGMRLERSGDTPYLYGPQLPEAVPLADTLDIVDTRHFRLLGRSADMIKVAGKRLSLGELTRQLLAIDGVDDAVAFMPRDSSHQQRPAALVVAPRLQPNAIAALLTRQIDPVFVPRPLLRVERLPRNAVGKLPQAELDALLRQAREQQLAP